MMIYPKKIMEKNRKKTKKFQIAIPLKKMTKIQIQDIQNILNFLKTINKENYNK